MHKWSIMTLLLLTCAFLLCGWLFGFPYEKNKNITEVRKYVETKYGLTPTDIRISFSVDGMDSALVSAEELPFSFQVYINRHNKQVWHDLYLESLVEHYLEEFISDKLVSFGYDNNISVVLLNRFSKSNPELTVEKVNSNPNILLDNPDIAYSCSVDGVKIGSEKSFLIFNQITKCFNPTSIYFNYVDAGNKEQSVCIKESDFNKIQSKDDLLTVIR